MIYNNFRKLLFIPCLVTILVLASCQKNTDPNDPDTIPDEVKDSTLLIKSIVYVFDNGQDSIVEHYSYDTVNRKILITWNDDFNNYVADNTAAEFVYNNKGLLSHVGYKYPAGYTPISEDCNTIDIVYDAENVLQKITASLSDGSIEIVEFSKTALSSGNYQISWEETSSGLPGEKFPRKAVFNADDKNIFNIQERLSVIDTTPSGDYIYTNIIDTDSLIYDASGNVSKIFTTYTNSSLQYTESYTSYEFLARQTKGDQLYNQRQVILNGIADMPFGNSDLGSFVSDDALGLFSAILKYEYLQYSKYPIQTAKVYSMYDGTYKVFTAHSEFDNKNRLTKYIGFVDDYGSDLESEEYRINYYK